MLPSSMASSTPVTVTVCGTFQLAGGEGQRGRRDGALGGVAGADSAMVTSAVGCVFSTTVKVAVPPASVVTRPEVGVTVIPAASLSVLVPRRRRGSGRCRRRRAGGGRRDDAVGDVAVVHGRRRRR